MLKMTAFICCLFNQEVPPVAGETATVDLTSSSDQAADQTESSDSKSTVITKLPVEIRSNHVPLLKLF